jgi:hypothetical protein
MARPLRLRVDHFALSRADHDDAAALQPPAAGRLTERLRMHRGGRIKRVGDMRGDGHFGISSSPDLFVLRSTF